MTTTILMHPTSQCTTHRPSSHLAALGNSSMPLPMLWRLQLSHGCLATTQQQTQLASCERGPHIMSTTPLMHHTSQCATHTPSSHLAALGSSSMPLPMLWLQRHPTLDRQQNLFTLSVEAHLMHTSHSPVSRYTSRSVGQPLNTSASFTPSLHLRSSFGKSAGKSRNFFAQPSLSAQREVATKTSVNHVAQPPQLTHCPYQLRHCPSLQHLPYCRLLYLPAALSLCVLSWLSFGVTTVRVSVVVLPLLWCCDDDFDKQTRPKIAPNM